MGRNFSLGAALLLAATMAAAQVYKWVDKDGRTHYGEKPPEGVKAAPVNVPASPGASSAPAAAPGSPTWQQQETEFRKRQVKRDEAERAFKEREAEAAERAKICENARKRLEILRTPVAVYTRDDQGNRSYLDEAGRATEIAKEARREKDNCV